MSAILPSSLAGNGNTGFPGGGDNSLERLGYKQELKRELGPFASFCSGFSFVSILTTVFELFAFGYGFGGPAFAWTWPIVFIGQFAVTLVFAELAARYPIAGAIYQWSRRVSTDPLGWFAGWFMLIGYIVSVAAISIAMQSVLPSIWDGFQLVGGDASMNSTTGATNAIILGTITILICGAISSFGVKKMAIITTIGVTLEIIGVVLLIGVLFFYTQRGPEVVMQTNGVQGNGSYVWPFLASMLMSAYVMYGFDSAAELSEETNNPRETAPKAITRCMLVSALGGGLVILGALMASPDLTAPEMSSEGIAWIVKHQAGDVVGSVILAIVAVSIFSAALAIQASAVRVMFSMARDGRLPFARALSKVSPRTHTPLLPGFVVCALAIGVLLINLGTPGVFAAVTSVAVVIVYLAYLLVTAPLLLHRLRKHPVHSVPDPRYFNLGKWGTLVNLIAVVFGFALMVNVAWPRAEVYDPAGGHW
ncbi:MAG TPA: amino acid permease, partial [Ideonella sp.]|nr:amino acid permease [Ideonella sp.]